MAAPPPAVSVCMSDRSGIISDALLNTNRLFGLEVLFGMGVRKKLCESEGLLGE